MDCLRLLTQWPSGRRWRAPLITCINIELTFPQGKTEENLREPEAMWWDGARDSWDGKRN